MPMKNDLNFELLAQYAPRPGRRPLLPELTPHHAILDYQPHQRRMHRASVFAHGAQAHA